VREAGGLISDFNGDDKWLDSGEVLCANPKVFHEMLQQLKHDAARQKKPIATDQK